MSQPEKQVQPTTAASAHKPVEYHWLWVMCLLGVDYFSTLSYQPSFAFEVAGRLGPLATLVVVLVTLAGALPVYWYVAGRSSRGQGSIALIEQVVHGWRGKSLVLILLGFAATDFIMVKTISVADAAVHAIGNPAASWQDTLDSLTRWSSDFFRDSFGQGVANFFNKQLIVTLILGFLGFIFWFLLRQGFNRNAIVVAVPLVAAYLLCNALIVGSGVWHLARQPEILAGWWQSVLQGGQHWQLDRESWLIDHAGFLGHWGLIVLLCLVFFPQLSLGLSGFEMSLILMPQVKGQPGDDPRLPRGRIRNTRKALVLAAMLMSVFLLGSTLVTGLLIPPEELRQGGRAANRALAYLAHGGVQGADRQPLHGIFGPAFGTFYDVVAVLILTLAGTSVVTALSNLLPRFLFRFGMELAWSQRWGVLLFLFGLVNVLVTLWFQASVDDQRGAYATAVLVLFTSASLISGRHRWKVRHDQPAKKRSRLISFLGSLWNLSGLAGLVFLFTALAVMLRSPQGLLIAAGFIAVLFAMSIVSRALRTNELRTIRFDLKDEHSKFLWDSLRLADFPVLVPHRPGRHARDLKEEQIRRDHNLDPHADVVFLETELEDPSNFMQSLSIEVFQEEKRFVIKVTHCVSVAHAIAAVALEMSKVSKPPALHFGWSEMDLMAASWSYFAFGEGNVPWKVRELILRAEKNADRQPRVIIG